MKNSSDFGEAEAVFASVRKAGNTMLQQLLNGIVAGSVYALVALRSSDLPHGSLFFHFAHGAVYTLGAYIAYTFYSCHFM